MLQKFNVRRTSCPQIMTRLAAMIARPNPSVTYDLYFFFLKYQLIDLDFQNVTLHLSTTFTYKLRDNE